MVAPVRLQPLRQPPAIFRSLTEPPVPLEGADGPEVRLWLTADGEIVSHPTGRIRSGLRRLPISRRVRNDLGDDVDDLGDVLAAAAEDGEGEILAHVGDLGVVEALPAGAVTGRVWLGHGDVDRLGAWRTSLPAARLVHVTRAKSLASGPERHVAGLATAHVDALALPWSDWSAGLVALAHRFDRFAVATDLTFRRHLEAVVPMGVDAVVTHDPGAALEVLGRRS